MFLNQAVGNSLQDLLQEMIVSFAMEKFGIKPSVTSSINGFSVLLGYMLCPFNVNFFTIARHWGLNPKDSDFTSMSSGDTPDAENEMFASLGIRPTKSIRKLYQKYPQGIIGYAAVKDLGITDVNLLMKSTTSKWYAFFKFYMITISEGDINYPVRRALMQFTQDMLVLSNQKTVWNSLDRTIKLEGKAFKAYSEWCQEKHIVRRKAFSIQCHQEYKN